MNKVQPVIGVVYDFNSNNLYEGTIDGEAKLNGSVIRVSDANIPKEDINLAVEAVSNAFDTYQFSRKEN